MVLSNFSIGSILSLFIRIQRHVDSAQADYGARTEVALAIVSVSARVRKYLKVFSFQRFQLPAERTLQQNPYQIRNVFLSVVPSIGGPVYDLYTSHPEKHLPSNNVLTHFVRYTLLQRA